MRLSRSAFMFDYYESDEELPSSREESRLLTWMFRLAIACLIVASVVFFSYALCIECTNPERHRVFARLFLLSGAAAWGTLVFRLRAWSNRTWFYGLFERMVKAALIVIGGQILTVVAIILLSEFIYH